MSAANLAGGASNFFHQIDPRDPSMLGPGGRRDLFLTIGKVLECWVCTTREDFSGIYFGGKHVPIPLYEVRFAKSLSLPPQCYQFLCHLSPHSASKQAHRVFVTDPLTHRHPIISHPSHHLPQGVFHVKTDLIFVFYHTVLAKIGFLPLMPTV